MDRIKRNKVKEEFRVIVHFAKSKGLLSPLWLTPNSHADAVQDAFKQLETVLENAYRNDELRDISRDDLNDFIWHLKKEYAFSGWDGIAHYLLSPVTTFQSNAQGFEPSSQN